MNEEEKFRELHKDADLIEVDNSGKVMAAVYFSEEYKNQERRRWRDGHKRMEQAKSQISPGMDAPLARE